MRPPLPHAVKYVNGVSAVAEKYYDARFAGYTGKKRFDVTHPRHGRLTVCAPDQDAAIVAAAGRWKTDWTRVEYYSNCSVVKSAFDTQPPKR